MRREQLEKLNSLSDDELKVAIAKTEKYLKLKLSGKTKWGAHSEIKLGVNPVDHYLEVALIKTYNGDWTWKFDKYTLGEHLIRGIDGMLSNEVRNHRKALEKKENVKIVELIPDLVEDYFDNSTSEEEIYSLQVKIIEEAIGEDEDMLLLWMCVQEHMSYDDICKETNWGKRYLYRVKDKLVKKAKKIYSDK